VLLCMCKAPADEVIIVTASAPQPSALGIKCQTRQDEDVEWSGRLEHCASRCEGVSSSGGLD
jgi:hypothetical protein